MQYHEYILVNWGWEEKTIPEVYYFQYYTLTKFKS